MPPTALTSFDYSGHAKIRAQQRGISQEQFEKTVKEPTHKKIQNYKGEHGGITYQFKRSFEGRTLVIIAEVTKGAHCIFITGYWN